MPLTASPRQRGAMFAAFIGLSIVPVLGLAAYRLAGWSLFTGGLADYSTGAKFAARVLQVCTLVLVAVLDRKVAYSERTVRNAVGVSAVISAATTAGVLFVPNPTAVLVCAGLHGIAMTLLMVGWGYYLCSVDPRQSALTLALGFALSGCIGWLFSFLPIPAVHGLAIGSPLVATLCLLYELSRAEGTPAPDDPLTRASLHALPTVLILLLGACTLTGVFVHTLVPTNQIQAGGDYQSITALVYLAVGAVFFVWVVVLGRPDPERLLPLFPAVTLGGLVCYTSFIGQWPALAMNILTATQNCTIIFCWMATAVWVYRLHLPRVFSFCVANIVFAEPITLSITVRGMLDPTGHVAGSMLAIAITLALALVLVVLTVGLAYAEAVKTARADASPSAAGPTVPEAAPADPLMAAIESMADDYALTAREQEVALHLARGHTFPETTEALGVSLDTVRTHVKCLYRKTGVHKKGHFIALIEERRPDREALG